MLIAYSLDRVSAWLVTLAALIITYQLTNSIGYATAVILVQVLGRAVVILVIGPLPNLRQEVIAIAGITRAGAIAGLILFDARADIWWAVLLVALASLSTGIVEAGYAQLIPILGYRKHLPTLNRSIGRSEQASAVAGPALTAAALVIVDERAVFALAALLSYVSLVLFRRMAAEVQDNGSEVRENAGARNPFTPEDWRLPRQVRAVVTGLVAMAALGIVVRLALLEVVISHLGYTGAVYALLIGLVGIGALVGPMPVDRVLGHFPVSMVLAGGVGAVAIAAVVMSLGSPLFIVIPALLATGLVIATLDITASVIVRRAVPEHATSDVNDALLRLVLLGQFGALIVVFVLSTAWDVRSAALVVSGLCATAVGVHFLRSGGLRSVSKSVSGDADKNAPSASAS